MPFRATAYDVVADSEYVYIATGYGVQLYSTTGTAGTLVATVPLPGSTRVLLHALNRVYVGSGTRIFIVKRSGATLTVAGSVEAGGTVNDLVAKESYLYAATSTGLKLFTLADADHPLRLDTSLATSRTNVLSLAIAGTTLYAADGDSSVEEFSISFPAIPQPTGTISSLPRSISVHTDRGFVFVSDDLGQTEVFLNRQSWSRIPYGSNAFMPLGGTRFLAAGTDRYVRTIDITNAARPAKLFEQQFAPAGGTSNRIYAFALAGGRYWAAAGDMGIVTFDAASLAAAQQPLISYIDDPTSSARVIGTDAIFTENNRVSVSSIDAGISLSEKRAWTAGTGAKLQDHGSGTVLVSSDRTVKVWTHATGAEARAVTFRAAVKSALLLPNNTIVALLTDGSVWTATDTTPAQVNLSGATMSELARAGSAIALANITNEGKTQIRYYANGDLAAQPVVFTIDGAVTGGIALTSTHAAAFTFNGINVINLANGNVSVLPDSHRTIPQQLQFVGDALFVLSDRTLTVWSAIDRTKLREHALPASAIAMHADATHAAVATADGKMVLDHRQVMPRGTHASHNMFYEQVAAAGDRLYLFDETRVDVFSISSGVAPDYVTTVDTPGAIAIAATSDSFFTFAANGTVTAFTKAGGRIAQTAIDQGADAQPLAIVTAGNAVWVSFSKGCSSGACQETTLVLDPKTLALTATMNGGVRDAFVSGTRAYALFEMPQEIRVFNIAEPRLPSPIATAPAPANAKSIGFAASRVHVLADKVYSYNESLIAAGEFLQPMNAPNALMRVHEGCAIVTGRSENPEFLVPPDFGGTLELTEVPSTIRSIAVVPGRLFFLTDHSLEVWMTGTPASPVKKRGIR